MRGRSSGKNAPPATRASPGKAGGLTVVVVGGGLSSKLSSDSSTPNYAYCATMSAGHIGHGP